MRLLKIKDLLFIFHFMSVIALAAPPEWTRQNGIQQNETTLVVVSTGSGPSLDLARRSAIDQAKTTAADQVNGSANIQSLSIETEKSVSFHSEVSSTKKVEGLVCKPLNEYVEDKEGFHKVWLSCEFDLKKARVRMGDETQDQSNGSRTSEITSLKSVEIVGDSISTSSPVVGKISHGENRHLILSVVPSCESILVRGKQSRTIPCKRIPVTVLLLPTDKEVIVRGPAGFAPKHLKVHGDVQNVESEVLEVYLEKM